MSKDKKQEEEQISFEYKLREVSDQEIISILRYREHFQEHARKAAIKEALKRGIIQSLEDLELDEFKAQAIPARSIFPLAVTEKQNLALLKSLCRIFYGIALLPVLNGIFKIASNEIWPAISSILIGLVIFAIANRLDKTLKPFFAQLLLALNVPAMGFAIYRLMQLIQPTIMDIFATIIVISVLLYTTFYANKLASYFEERKEI